jgi:hypothetical protein
LPVPIFFFFDFPFFFIAFFPFFFGLSFHTGVREDETGPAALRHV